MIDPAAQSVATERSKRILMRFYRTMDDGDVDAVLKLFADGATWERRGTVLRNKAEFRQALLGKAPTLLQAHLVVSVDAEPIAMNRIGFVGLVIATRSDTGLPPTPAIFPTCVSTHRCHGEIWETPAGWGLGHYCPGDPVMEAGAIGPMQYFAWPRR